LTPDCKHEPVEGGDRQGVAAVGRKPALAAQLHQHLLAVRLLRGYLETAVHAGAVALRVVEKQIERLRDEHGGKRGEAVEEVERVDLEGHGEESAVNSQSATDGRLTTDD
jgi:hypothetical protein